jgi:alanine dehydrogenase
MKIGTVKEVKTHEYRVGLTPSNVRDYVNGGHEVFVQAGAGAGSFFTDEEYSDAGAKIVADAKEIWATCEMIVKVKEPLQQEYDLMREFASCRRPQTYGSSRRKKMQSRCVRNNSR